MKNISELEKMMQMCKEGAHEDIIKTRLCVVQKELEEGFKLVNKYEKSVTIFGSARFPEEHPYSLKATELAKRLAEHGYAIVTGGGHGIMGAAHKGAYLAGGASVGMNIELPHEQTMNEYISDYLEFHHFFTRKVVMAYSAEAYIYFPGGFGTMDEFFEILTLKQTRKIPNVPIYLFGAEYWTRLELFFREVLLKFETISPEDLTLYTITDDIDEVVQGVLNSPLRRER